MILGLASRPVVVKLLPYPFLSQTIPLMESPLNKYQLYLRRTYFKSEIKSVLRTKTTTVISS